MKFTPADRIWPLGKPVPYGWVQKPGTKDGFHFIKIVPAENVDENLRVSEKH